MVDQPDTAGSHFNVVDAWFVDYGCDRDSLCLRRIYPWCGDATRVLYGGMRRKIEPVAVVFLLPIFFTFSGLNTRLDTVNQFQLFLIATVVLLDYRGEGAACWLAAR